MRKNGTDSGVLAPGKRELYRRGPVELRVDVLSLREELKQSPALAKVLVRARQPLAPQVADAVMRAVEPRRQ